MESSEKHILIYDFVNETPRLFFPLVMFLFAFIGILFMRSVLNTNTRNKTDSLGFKNNTRKFTIGLFFTAFGTIFGFYLLNLSDYFKTKEIYNKSEFVKISGYVKDKKVFSGKHDQMYFYVNNQYFKFSTNQTEDYGCDFNDLRFSEIKDSTFLNIYYFNKMGKNIVLRIEKELL